MSQARLLSLVSVFCVICASATGAAAAEAVAAEAGDGAKASREPDKGGLDRSGLDPTKLYDFAGVAHDQNTNNEVGSDATSDVVKGQLAFDNLAVHAELPLFVRVNPGLGTTKDGLGDLAAGITFAKELKPTFWGALRFDASFNTASDDRLGSNAIILSPAAYGSFVLDDSSRIIGGLRWAASIYTESDVPDTNRLEVPVEWLHALPQGIFVGAGGRLGREFEVDRWALSGVAHVGMVINQRHTFRLGVDVPVSTFSRDVDGQELTIDYAYNF